jgi:hypothetical protein
MISRKLLYHQNPSREKFGKKWTCYTVVPTPRTFICRIRKHYLYEGILRLLQRI